MAEIVFRDGDLLPGGKVVSVKGGFWAPVYRCGCGREQTAYIEDCFYWGISEIAARMVGWNLADGGWMCPSCSGSNKNLLRLFHL